MGRRKKGRDLDGVILVNKPLGGSSNQILQKIRWIYNAKKAGHTGALDPLASGMLPICFGNSTKFAQYSLDADKTYEVTAKLGIRTTTSDADGEVVAERQVNVSSEQLNRALDTFRGQVRQVPSMYSALKHEGKPLYFYARQGITIERPARDITIYRLELHRFENDEIELTVKCSKGTYIRSLIDDLGELLGCGAYVTRLHRTQVSGYMDLPMYLPEELEALKTEDSFDALDRLLLPVDAPILHLPRFDLEASKVDAFRQGQQLKSENMTGSGAVRIYDPQNEQFLGVAECTSGHITPKRLIAHNP